MLGILSGCIRGRIERDREENIEGRRQVTHSELESTKSTSFWACRSCWNSVSIYWWVSQSEVSYTSLYYLSLSLSLPLKKRERKRVSLFFSFYSNSSMSITLLMHYTLLTLHACRSNKHAIRDSDKNFSTIAINFTFLVKSKKRLIFHNLVSKYSRKNKFKKSVKIVI